jgi:hypothetical protein
MSAKSDRVLEERLDAVADNLLKDQKRVDTYTETTEPPEGTDGGLVTTSTNGRIRLWNRATGEASDIATDQLRQRLRQRFGADHHMAGELVYTEEPMEGPPPPAIPCYFHPESPERNRMDSYGLTTVRCEAKLVNLYAQELHIQRKHPSAWAMIQREQAATAMRTQAELLARQTAVLERLGAET